MGETQKLLNRHIIESIINYNELLYIKLRSAETEHVRVTPLGRIMKEGLEEAVTFKQSPELKASVALAPLFQSSAHVLSLPPDQSPPVLGPCLPLLSPHPAVWPAAPLLQGSSTVQTFPGLRCAGHPGSAPESGQPSAQSAGVGVPGPAQGLGFLFYDVPVSRHGKADDCSPCA